MDLWIFQVRVLPCHVTHPKWPEQAKGASQGQVFWPLVQGSFNHTSCSQ